MDIQSLTSVGVHSIVFFASHPGPFDDDGGDGDDNNGDDNGDDGEGSGIDPPLLTNK